MYIGIDPDLHTLPVAVVGGDGKVFSVQVCRISENLKGQDAVIGMCGQFDNIKCDIKGYYEGIGVESQEISYSAKSGANPRSMIPLAQVAGAALSAFRRLSKRMFMPMPAEWKGQVPKQIHQARIMAKLRWSYEKVGTNPKTGYCRPTGAIGPIEGLEQVNPGDWKHVMDAIGLALWCREQCMKGKIT